MNNADARAIAKQIKLQLAEYADPIIIAGSIRRGKPQVRDIDMVLVPTRLGQLLATIMAMGPKLSGGEKAIRIRHQAGIDVDIYLATPDTIPTLVLVRTGSAQFNRLLASELQRRGLKLLASGAGVVNTATGEIVARTEREILRAAGWNYKAPWAREWPVQLAADNAHLQEQPEVLALDQER